MANVAFIKIGERLVNVGVIADVELEDFRRFYPEPAFSEFGVRLMTYGPVWRRPCVTITLAVQQGIDGSDGATEARSITLFDDEAEAVRHVFSTRSWRKTLGVELVDTAYALSYFRNEKELGL
jgi:hypothetical protein